MTTDIKVNKPVPFVAKKQIVSFDPDVEYKVTIKALEKGKPLLITTVYGDGLLLLKKLRMHLSRTLPNTTFEEQREFRKVFKRLSNRILVKIAGHKLEVDKAPVIGWFEKLYPEKSDFILSFPQVQGLNSAWQWYLKGIQVPVLRNKVHPYYGTYFPTRFDHLILFDNWLKRYEGTKKSAIEVGIGSGILSFQLIKHGFQKVFATDTNPNAIVGLQELMGDTKLSRKIELDHNDLFGKWDKPAELIVFNPPWLPEAHEAENLDTAIYYNDKLFPEFFEEAKKRLAPEGKLVVIFSNLAQITEVTTDHPIAQEVANGGRFKLEACLKRGVKAASDKTKRDINWRSDEEVELWILTH